MADDDELKDKKSSESEVKEGNGLLLEDPSSLKKFKKTNAYLRCTNCDHCIGQYLIYRE